MSTSHLSIVKRLCKDKNLNNIYLSIYDCVIDDLHIFYTFGDLKRRF